MNRKIATIAIIVAFVGGMIVAGTPVEAKKGGGGSVIDEVLAAIDALDGRVTTLENSKHLYIIQFNNYQQSQRGTVQNGDEHRFDRQMITKGGTLTEVQYGHGVGNPAIMIGNQVLAKVYLNGVQIGACTTVIAVNEQMCDLNITPTRVSRGDMLEITDFGIVNNGIISDLDVTEKYASLHTTS